jgi:hypothetical protein
VSNESKHTTPGPLPAIIRLGRWLLGACITALVIGNIVSRKVFPERQGKGLDATILAILIPIWSLGIVGIVLLLVGWVRYPALDPTPQPPSNYSKFTNGLINFTLWLMVLMLSAVLFAEELPWWQRILIFYVAETMLWTGLYLRQWYVPGWHLATTTYLNHFTSFFGILLAPITWPMLIIVNRKAIRSLNPPASS